MPATITSLPSAAAWSAPTASTPVRAVVRLPGSKSLTNRALILAALADGPSRISAPLRARDTLLMAAALRALGTDVRDAPSDATGAGDWLVSPARLHGASIDAGLAGTVMRFVPAVAALADGDVLIDGDEQARARPMNTLIDSLRQAGVQIDDGGAGLLPFTIRGSGGPPQGGAVHLDASASSQFVSALLLAGARYRDGLQIRHTGGALPSLPHIEMTIAMLRESGVPVEQPDSVSWRVPPAQIRARDIVIEPDLSNAGPFLAAAAVTGGRIVVPGWPAATTQPGNALREILTRMGATIALTEEGLAVSGEGRLRGIDADLHAVGELTPVLVAVAALADGPSTFRGIAHLRGHETDRLSALAAEINGLGGDVAEQPDGLTVTPRALRGGRWRAYADHRMAQAGAVLGLRVAGIEIDDIASTTKTLPDFPGMWSRMLAS